MGFELIAQIYSFEPSLTTLRTLGDVFRDEYARRSEQTFESIPALVKNSCINFDAYFAEGDNQPLILENLRMLINLTADVDENRVALASKSSEDLRKFWDSLVELLQVEDWEVRDRTVIFFRQFIHNTEKLQEMYTFLGQLDLSKYLVQSLEQSEKDGRDVEVLQSYVEVAAEVSNAHLDNIMMHEYFASRPTENIDLVLTITEKALKESDDFDSDDLQDFYYHLSLLLSALTSFEDIPSLPAINANQRVFSILKQLPNDLENVTMVKRRFFAVSGNITSMRSYESIGDLKCALEYIKDKQSDPYLLSSCYITLGNYVTSSQKAYSLLQLVEEEYSVQELVNSFYSTPFNDVVQYQAIYLLTKLINNDNSGIFLNQERLMQISKVLIDNSTYYPDVFNILLTFLKKLFRIEFVTNSGDILSYRDLIELLVGSKSKNESQEIDLLALQALCKSLRFTNDDFTRKLISTALTIPTTNIDINILLQKIKTLGIFFKTILTNNYTVANLESSIYSSRECFENEFLFPLREFLQFLEKGLKEQKAESTQYKVLCNNSQFLCATVMSLLENESDLLSSQLSEISDAIVRIKI